MLAPGGPDVRAARLRSDILVGSIRRAEMPALNLRSRPVQVLIAALIGALAALAVSYGNLWLKCLQPTSEACVWSRAYLPLSLGLTSVILGVPVFVVTLILLRRYGATSRR